MGVARRSRVTPAVGSTMAMRRPARRLRREDLPTLGRPMMATMGSMREPEQATKRGIVAGPRGFRAGRVRFYVIEERKCMWYNAWIRQANDFVGGFIKQVNDMQEKMRQGLGN